MNARVRRALATKSRGDSANRRALLSELAAQRRHLSALETALRGQCERARASRARNAKRACAEHAGVARALTDVARYMEWLTR